MKPAPPTESEVRQLRDTCYGRKSTNDNWAAARDSATTGGHLGWLHADNVKWLREHQHPLHVDTSLQAVLDEAAALGLTLEDHDGQLGVIPKGKMTPEFAATLRLFKPEILARLKKV